VEVSKEHNIFEFTFDRWKRQFGQLDVNEARRMNELERKNAELKKYSRTWGDLPKSGSLVMLVCGPPKGTDGPSVVSGINQLL
jgi:hypothetical protein